MVKMVSLKKTAADRRAEKDAMGETAVSAPSDYDKEGPTVHLEHHHLKNMGVGGGLKSGDKVTLHAVGHVENSSTRSENGEERHSAMVRLHRGGIEHEAAERDGERKDLRNEIEKIHGASEEKREKRSEAAGAKRAVEGKKV